MSTRKSCLLSVVAMLLFSGQPGIELWWSELGDNGASVSTTIFLASLSGALLWGLGHCWWLNFANKQRVANIFSDDDDDNDSDGGDIDYDYHLPIGNNSSISVVYTADGSALPSFSSRVKELIQN